MKNRAYWIWRGLFGVVSAVFLFYLVLPNPKFPDPPLDSVQSQEEADTETLMRRAYFTNYSRAEVIVHYKKQFGNMPTLRLNYPPEEAQTLIRDQTRSVYLEELVHPFRESVFINGFIPRVAKDDIWYKGTHFEQKITVRFVPSSTVVRLLIAFLSLVLVWFLSRELI